MVKTKWNVEIKNLYWNRLRREWEMRKQKQGVQVVAGKFWHFQNMEASIGMPVEK